MVEIISKANLLLKNPPKPVAEFAKGFNISQHVGAVSDNAPVLTEFIGTGSLPADWAERVSYEVGEGRAEEPLLYTDIYDITVSSELPEVQKINMGGLVNVVFTKRPEGGETQFGTLSAESVSIEQESYSIGMVYSKEMFIYNRLWMFPSQEREVGIAYHALLNHAHLYPIISHSYPSKNITDGTALTNFKVSDPLWVKYFRTIESAIIASRADKPAMRGGPYALLTNGGLVFDLERALSPVPQQGFSVQSSAMSAVTRIINYDGWVGMRGHLVTEYPGVDPTKAYLISLNNKRRNFRSLMKQPLQSTQGNPDVSRQIMAQTIWDTYFGLMASVENAVQEIILPTADSGQPD